MVTYYCTSCWHESQHDISKCPNCGAVWAYWPEQIYAEKLVNSLTHPVRDYRLIAVQVLGNIRYAPAEPFLTSIIQTELDIEMVQAAAESIRKIHGYKNQNSIADAAHNRTDYIKKVCGI